MTSRKVITFAIGMIIFVYGISQFYRSAGALLESDSEQSMLVILLKVFGIVFIAAFMLWALRAISKGSRCPECGKAFALRRTGNVREVEKEGTSGQVEHYNECRCKYCEKIVWERLGRLKTQL